jgi:hypothetical protein
MDETGFSRFLKKSGKQEHVIQGLVNHVRDFEGWLAQNHQLDLAAVQEENLRHYGENLMVGEIKHHMRALALYFEYTSSTALSKLARALREQQTQKTRKSFKVRDFRGVDPVQVEKLEDLGIVTTNQLLTAGRTPADRKNLSQKTGIPQSLILEWVKLSDLSRIGAVKSVRARLYYGAGLDTPRKFIPWEAPALRHMLQEFIERTGFDGIAPLPKEMENAIADARHLPDLVEYEPQ